MCPCAHSSAKYIGIPNLVCSITYRCIALNNNTDCLRSRPVSTVFADHGSARNTAQNPPHGKVSIIALNASQGTTSSSLTLSYMVNPIGQHNCPTFSSMLILQRYSSIFLSIASPSVLAHEAKRNIIIMMKMCSLMSEKISNKSTKKAFHRIHFEKILSLS